jgi:hypothetical protein
MVSFVEIALVLLCAVILLAFITMTSYSCRMQVTGEKKTVTAQSGIDYVIIKIQNYFSPPAVTPSALPTTQQEYFTLKHAVQGLRHRTGGATAPSGGAISPKIDSNEKIKLV